MAQENLICKNDEAIQRDIAKIEKALVGLNEAKNILKAAGYSDTLEDLRDLGLDSYLYEKQTSFYEEAKGIYYEKGTKTTDLNGVVRTLVDGYVKDKLKVYYKARKARNLIQSFDAHLFNFIEIKGDEVVLKKGYGLLIKEYHSEYAETEEEKKGLQGILKIKEIMEELGLYPIELTSLFACNRDIKARVFKEMFKQK